MRSRPRREAPPASRSPGTAPRSAPCSPSWVGSIDGRAYPGCVACRGRYQPRSIGGLGLRVPSILFNAPLQRAERFLIAAASARSGFARRKANGGFRVEGPSSVRQRPCAPSQRLTRIGTQRGHAPNYCLILVYFLRCTGTALEHVTFLGERGALGSLCFAN